MRVLMLTQHFAPELTAAAVRVEAFAKGLANRDHDVEVVCSVPNHPEGIVRAEFRGRTAVRRTMNGFKVHHVWVRASARKDAFNRVLLYGSYAAMATVVGSALRRPDVVFASSPPLPVGVAAALTAARHRVPWVFDVRDPWPEAAMILGELSDGRLARLAERLERRLYDSAEAIVTVTEPFRYDITQRTRDPGKISVIMNGTTQNWLDTGAIEVDRGPLDLPEDRFIWAYAGNLGLAQGLEAALDAAGLLGDGRRRPRSTIGVRRSPTPATYASNDARPAFVSVPEKLISGHKTHSPSGRGRANRGSAEGRNRLMSQRPVHGDRARLRSHCNGNSG